MTASRRFLHDDETRALEVAHDALGGDGPDESHSDVNQQGCAGE
jgi:hypothetical protein